MFTKVSHQRANFQKIMALRPLALSQTQRSLLNRQSAFMSMRFNSNKNDKKDSDYAKQFDDLLGQQSKSKLSQEEQDFIARQQEAKKRTDQESEKSHEQRMEQQHQKKA